MTTRRPEWIAAEEALTHACQRALDRGLCLYHDTYGVTDQLDPYDNRVYQVNCWVEDCFKEGVCAIGSFLINKVARGGLWDDDASRLLRVSREWLASLQDGFTGEVDAQWYRTHDALDGLKTGLRLFHHFSPKSSLG